mmetsp:Transcript_18265/g.57139  ORF Transcript_18265/g.57139 Transcript_18265/m.57139 type:complete len:208 (+) Transcript_18265:190-813(+)
MRWPKPSQRRPFREGTPRFPPRSTSRWSVAGRRRQLHSSARLVRPPVSRCGCCTFPAAATSASAGSWRSGLVRRCGPSCSGRVWRSRRTSSSLRGQSRKLPVRTRSFASRLLFSLPFSTLCSCHLFLCMSRDCGYGFNKALMPSLWGLSLLSDPTTNTMPHRDRAPVSRERDPCVRTRAPPQASRARPCGAAPRPPPAASTRSGARR